MEEGAVYYKCKLLSGWKWKAPYAKCRHQLFQEGFLPISSRLAGLGRRQISFMN
jgi:hypothetical protein